MAQLHRYLFTLQDRLGNALSGVAVAIRKQSAQVNGAQSGVSPLTVNVFNPGGIVAGDTVRVGTGTTEYAVDSATATTVVLSGFGGTLALADGDRLGPVTNLPSLYSNPSGSGSALSSLSTDSDGKAACWTEGRFHQIHLSGGALSAAILLEDQTPGGWENVNSDVYNSGSAVAFIRNAKRALGAADKIESWRVAGSEKISFGGTGIIAAVGLTLSDDLTVGDDLTVTDDATIGGDLSVTGTLTAGGLSAPAADLTVDELFATNQPRCKASRSAPQTLANNTLTTLTWDAEEFDTGGLHSTVTNNSRITVPASEGGVYLVTLWGKFTANATGDRRILQIVKNGSTTLAYSSSEPNSIDMGGTITTIDVASPGDYYEGQAHQDSGGNLDIFGKFSAVRLA